MKLYKKQVRLCGKLQINTHEIPEYRTLTNWTDEEDLTAKMVEDATKKYRDKDGFSGWDFYTQGRFVEVEDTSIDPETCPYCGKSNTRFVTAWVADYNLFTEEYCCKNCDEYYHVDYDFANPRYQEE